MDTTERRPRRRRRDVPVNIARAALLAAAIPTTLAQSCISLSGSSQCPAFNASSISTTGDAAGLFPFLTYVTDVASFDSGLETYIASGFIQQRFGSLIGCSAFNISDPTEYYARYTTSVLCNTIIQNSISACSLTGEATAPLCASTCALYATSEDAIAAGNACGTQGANGASQIRADLTNCQLPAQSLAEMCISGATNQPDRCGFENNLSGLCDYCGSNSPNATDSCCVFSDVETLCQGISLPITSVTSTGSVSPSSTSPHTSSTTSATALATDRALSSDSHRLSGGAIAGLVIGTLLGGALLLALLICGCVLLRRRQEERANSPHSPQMAQVQHDGAGPRPPRHPSGRITSMGTLNPEHDAWFAFPDARFDSHGRDSPLLQRSPPLRGKSSKIHGIAMVHDNEEAVQHEDASSPETTGQSEQLTAFKDYYSQDEIRTGDAVSVLWAYQPRAQDEFELERGDMLKVVGIWDDGWATGVRINSRADNYESRSNRDSGVDTDEDGEQEVKAFPLVCVCLPRYWRQTIDGDNFPGS